MLYKLILIGMMTSSSLGCQAIRPYEKEFLVHPLMDDVTLRRLDDRLMISQSQTVEKLGGGLGASGSGTSCPTCGG